jgi:quercetin dioxygenase-like cupin family protein
MEPRLIPSAKERRFRLVGIDVHVRAGVDDTGGALTALEQCVPPGAGSPLHTVREDKVLLVLDGELGVELGPRRLQLRAGDGVTIPGGAPHRFVNEQQTNARLMMLVLPGGHERYLAELAGLEARASLTETALRELGERFGVAVLAATESGQRSTP